MAGPTGGALEGLRGVRGWDGGAAFPEPRTPTVPTCWSPPHGRWPGLNGSWLWSPAWGVGNKMPEVLINESLYLGGDAGLPVV